MFALRNTTKSRSNICFEKIKNKILGKQYNLSLVLCGNYLMRKLSLSYKGNTKHTNVLSFPLTNDEGEIFLNIHKKELSRLFIHGCLHLKGYRHGKEMDELEDSLLKLYPISNK